MEYMFVAVPGATCTERLAKKAQRNAITEHRHRTSTAGLAVFFAVKNCSCNLAEVLAEAALEIDGQDAIFDNEDVQSNFDSFIESATNFVKAVNRHRSAERPGQKLKRSND